MKSEGKDYLASMGIYLIARSWINGNPDTKDLERNYPTSRNVLPIRIGPTLEILILLRLISVWHDVPQFNLFDNDNKIYTRPRLFPPSKFKKQ
jgi:glucose-1-phosphate adenylyltransferase